MKPVIFTLTEVTLAHCGFAMNRIGEDLDGKHVYLCQNPQCGRSIHLAERYPIQSYQETEIDE